MPASHLTNPAQGPQTQGIHNQIRDFVRQQCQQLPGTLPIQYFQHRHPLWHLTHLPFAKAVQQSMRDSGHKSVLFLKDFRTLHAQGRILESDLIAILTAEPHLDLDKVIATLEGKDLCQGDIYLAALLHPIVSIRSIELAWAQEETQATEEFQADVPLAFRERLLAGSDATTETEAVQDLWKTCLELLGLEHQVRHPEEYLDLSPDRVEQLLEQLDTEEEDNHEWLRMDRLVRKSARLEVGQLFERLGNNLNLRGLLKHLTGRDLLEDVTPLLLPILGNYLDLGQASWRTHEQSTSFYHFWRTQAAHDLSLVLGDFPQWQQQLHSLPEDPMEALVARLKGLGLRQSMWFGYLETLIQELPGWNGQVAGRGETELLGLLAVRMVLDELLAERLCQQIWRTGANLEELRAYFLQHSGEFFVRHHLFNKRLPEYLAHQAQLLLKRNLQETNPNAKHWWQVAHRINIWLLSRDADRPQGRSVLQDGWRLFRLAQHLGISGKRLRSLDEGGVERILDCLDHISDPFKVSIWQQAYEFHYRNQLFNAILQNHSLQKKQPPKTAPWAQIITSMDNRLEGLRRHLEEIDPQIETLGLAPPSQRTAGITHKYQRIARRPFWQQWLFQAAHNQPLTAFGLSTIGAPLGILDLGLRLLWPSGHQLMLKGWARPDKQQPFEKFTDEEQLAIATEFLRSLGIAGHLAPLVMILGQTASSHNNSCKSTYQGQCLGLGPDRALAPLLASICNRPEIRARLAQTGIEIPAGSWFLALTHDSSSQEIHWHDLKQLPEGHKAAFTRLKSLMTEAQGRHAQEGCRRLQGAPQSLNHKRSLHYLKRRSLAFNQPIPELGHAGIAAAVIGRRALSRGLFLDRRVCLLSYDPHQENPGQHDRGLLLERLLQQSLPPLLDLCLSHFLSRVDDQGWGSGSQALHSINGLGAITKGSEPDLATGLAAEMVREHEPMRLQLVLDSDCQSFTAILQRNSDLAKLFKNAWLNCAVFDATKAMLFVFEPATAQDPSYRLVPWSGPYQALPRSPSSSDWYFGQRAPLAPALITPALIPSQG